MLKFIHLTNAYTGKKLAINLDHCVVISEQATGETLIEFHSSSRYDNQVRVKESFDEIEQMIYEYNDKIRT